MSDNAYSIAVLPFVNMTSDPENEYFSDGVTEEIINALTRIEGLQVTARTSSFAFKGKNRDIREIGQELGVETVLEGSVRKAGNRVRITAQLIKVKDGYHLWSENYDRHLEDIFSLQDEISLKIAHKCHNYPTHPHFLNHQLKTPTANMDAYQIYLKGRYYSNKWAEEDFRIAIELYEEAIDLAPDFALPYAGMAGLYTAMGALAMISNQEASEKARFFIKKALTIDDQRAECLMALSGIMFWYEWEFAKAMDLLEEALSIVPGNAEAMGFLGLYKAFSGKLPEGKRELERALKADPYSLQLHFAKCVIYQIEEDFEGMYQEADLVLQLHPKFWRGVLFKAHAAYFQEKYDEAIRHFETIYFNEQPGVIVTAAGGLACCYLKMGDLERSEKYINQVLQAFKNDIAFPCAAYCLVMYYQEKNQAEVAIAYLKQGIAKKVSDFVFLPHDPTFRPLWQHPEFFELAENIKRRGERKQLGLVVENKTRYATSNLQEEDACIIDERLMAYMQEEKPFLDNQLCLPQLAEELGINTNYLSQVINERHGKNFVEFINEYRVAALKSKLENPDNRQFTILSLAFDCGFNSKTTFNTAFKKITGLTPSQYLKKVG
ncbi:MAG: hypothetical protein DHS20C18_11440 [Saprospiraceae bacterium]|nr:MAG: hypothetical protein DHS20C18_11440 [Saprospiraceae bacterium]